MILDDQTIRRIASAVVDELISRGLCIESERHHERELETKQAAFRMKKSYDGFRLWAARRNIRSRKVQTPKGPRRLWSVEDIETASALALAEEAAYSAGVRLCSDDKST